MEFLKQFLVSVLPLVLLVGIPFIAVMIYRLIRRKAGKARGGMIENTQRIDPDVVWKWRGIRWIIGYALFWIVAGGGAGIIARNSSPEIQEGASSAFVIFIILILLIWCAGKDRGNKSALEKVVWVFGLLIAHGIVSVIVTFSLFGLGIGGPANLQRYSVMIAGYIILYFAMRRSTIFIQRVKNAN